MRHALLLVILTAIATGCAQSDTAQNAEAGSDAHTRQASSSNDDLPMPGTTWHYLAIKDRMTDEVSHAADIFSTQLLPATGPYTAQPLALAVIEGKIVTLRTFDQQFNCIGADGCTIQVRFDREKARSFIAHELGNIKPPTLTIDDGTGFIAALQGHKEMLIQVNIFDEGPQTVAFNIAGYDDAKRMATVP